MIKIQNLKKNYGDFSLDCTLSVEKGRITGLVGKNGAGKSTAFKALLGLIKTDGGTVTVLGKEPRNFTASDRERIGVVLSDSGFSGYLRVKDIIPIMKNMYKSFDEKLFKEGLDRFELPINKKIKELSTGMKAKLKLVAAVSHGADLLVLDEPTAGLDVIARDDLLALLREFMEKNENASILISSHISSDLETLCDDIYMIHGGKIIFHEDTDVLLSDYGLLKVDENRFCSLDKKHLLCFRKETYGYSCLTNQRRFYRENEPDVIIEHGSIDTMITMLIKGERI